MLRVKSAWQRQAVCRHAWLCADGGAVRVQRRNERLWAAGLQEEAACRSLVNPGFTEVFGIEEHTLDNPRYRVCGVPLMSGKLDWLLHRGALTVADSAIGNHDYSASDHKWLAADFVIGVADDSVPPDR